MPGKKKKLEIGTRVAGCHGESFMPPVDPANPNKRRRKRKRRIEGQISYAVGKERWKVIWDNGTVGDYSSKSLAYLGPGRPLMPRQSRSRVLDGPGGDLPPPAEPAVPVAEPVARTGDENEAVATLAGMSQSSESSSTITEDSNSPVRTSPSSARSVAVGVSALLLAAGSSVQPAAMPRRVELPPAPPLPPVHPIADGSDVDIDYDQTEEDVFKDADCVWDTVENDEARGDFWLYQKAVSDDKLRDMADKGVSVEVGDYKWTVVKEVASDEPEDYGDVGVRGFDFSERDGKRISLMRLLIHLWPGNWRSHLKLINDAIKAEKKEGVS